MTRQLVLRAIVFVLIVAGLYGLLRVNREELVDFRVPRLAAERFLAHESLYRPDDGHYQYKYFPAFAFAMTPFTLLPRRVAEITWFTLTVAMTWALLSLAARALPDRRRTIRALFWITLLLNTKFLVKEIGFGQFNLPVALLVMGAVMAAQRGAAGRAGVLVGAAVFVKPYALVLIPWLAWRLGWRALVPFGLVLVGGLALPAAFYGWDGNVRLLTDWYHVVSDTTAPNLMGLENMSLASAWAKWIEPGPAAAALALVSSGMVVAAGLFLMWRWHAPGDPHYLDVAYFLVLIPLLSPQGWDYVLVIALSAYMCLVDRWRESPPAWRAVALVAFALTSFTVFDLLGRWIYLHVMHWAGPTIGALLIAMCLIRLRSRRLA